MRECWYLCREQAAEDDRDPVRDDGRFAPSPDPPPKTRLLVLGRGGGNWQQPIGNADSNSEWNCVMLWAVTSSTLHQDEHRLCYLVHGSQTRLFAPSFDDPGACSMVWFGLVWFGSRQTNRPFSGREESKQKMRSLIARLRHRSD